jgi:diaminopropionate ammonia-lyase
MQYIAHHILQCGDRMRKNGRDSFMVGSIQLVHYDRKTEGGSDTSVFGYEQAKSIRNYHASFPGYRETPLVDLRELANYCGIAGIYVKDESYRFGLNAFKALGGSYAIGRIIASRLGIAPEKMNYATLTSPKIREKLGKMTFITATDGNHGRGVAWTARQLRQRCVVYMPRGSARERLNNIRAQGAEATITDLSYDDAVRKASEDAKKNGWVLVQDTAWDGYEEIPTWIMQGYTTMGEEALQQLGKVRPTHVFLQAGVGAMSGAVAGLIADYYGDRDRPVVTIVEPDKADCLFRTAKAADGTLHTVTTEMNTIMAGLACGVPCTVGWNVLRDHADNFVSMPDTVAAKGMRILGNPLGDDRRVVSGESGAAGFGFLMTVLLDSKYKDLKRQLGIDPNSRILCFSTEGDTDRENYRKIVWDGAYASL